MKAFYYFTNIVSTSDQITIKSYDVDVMTFKRSDYGGTFNNLLNTRIELSPYQCADLDQMTAVGEESHPVADYPASLKDKWFNFARNKISEDYFNNNKRLDDANPEQPVEILNKQKITNTKELITFINKLSLFTSKNLNIDLSNLDIAEEFTINEGSSDTTCGYNDGINTYSFGTTDSTSINKSIKNILYKSYPLPKNLLNLDFCFYECSKLKDISNIDTMNATSINSAFARTGVESLETLNFPKVISAQNAFNRCPALSEVGDINLPLATSITGMFSYCDNLREIGNISIPSVESTIDFLPSYITKVGDIYLDNLTTIAESGSYKCLFRTKTLQEIGNIYIPTQNNGYIFHTLGSDLKTIQSIYIYNIDRFVYQFNSNNDSCVLDYLGPVCVSAKNPINAHSTSYNSGKSFPRAKEAVALPHYYCNNSFPLASSTGFSQWVDYYAYNSEVIHVITKTTKEFNYHISSITKNISYDMPIENILEVADNYPYSITIDNITSYGTSTASNCVNCKSANFVQDDNGNTFIHIEIENATDDTIATCTLTLDGIEYEATILGHPFRGKTKVIYSCTIATTIDEEASFTIEIEDDPEELENN